MKIWLVDSFTEAPFTGNPAAVVMVEGEVDAHWMQRVGQEMNLSETAFLTPVEDDPSRFGLRWFTPTTEVDLCGHATLAAAHVLWSSCGLDRAVPIQFETRSGVLLASQRDGRIELDFPSLPSSSEPLGIPVHELIGEDFVVLNEVRSQYDFLLQLKNEADVRALRPNLARLRQMPFRGLIVTAEASQELQRNGIDLVSRFFAPAAGVDEDPVTGSAHCVLAPYWYERFGKTNLTGYQVSPRGGLVHIRYEGARTVLSGKAVTVVRGFLLV